MNASAELVERLGVALLHSLWQGSLVGAALLIVLLALRHVTAQARYLACCVALVLMLSLPVATFCLVHTERPVASLPETPQPSRLVTSAAAALEVAASLLPEELPGLDRDLDPASSTANEETLTAERENVRPWLSPHASMLLAALVWGWGAGVVLLSFRVLGGYLVAWRLTRRLLEPLDESWQARFRQIAARLDVRVPIELWQSACIEAPAVIGCFRPVVLIPLGMLAGLSAAQVEAVLAHELAHIRRYDFLVNAVQCAIETLLFYHPCAWWISARIRAEREHCCDDLAVAACGNTLVYARALAGLEELRTPARLAMALTGGGSLLGRVRRLVGRRRTSDVVGGWLAGSLAIVLPLAVGTTWSSGRGLLPFGNPSGADALSAGADEKAAGPRLGATDIDRSSVDAALAEGGLFRDAVKLTNDLAAALSTVSDAASAAAVAEKIVELSRRHADVERRLRELRRSLDPDREARLTGRWIGELEQSARRLRLEVARVERLPGAVDALRSSVLFEVIGLHGAPPAPVPTTVDFLVPSGMPTRFMGPIGVDPLERMRAEHPPERIVKVEVLRLPGDVYEYVYERLRQILPNVGFLGTGAGDTATVYLAPISDIDAFAAQIDLGEVTAIDHETRTITVAADPTRLPPPKVRPTPTAEQPRQDEAADPATLAERLARHDHTAVADLIAWGDEAEPVAIEYAAHADRRVRRDALLILKKIGGEDSLPAAIRGLADSDLGNRDLAWQIVCRSSTGMRSRAVIEAAATGLETDPEQAAKWLMTLGGAAESQVVPYTQHRLPTVRRQAALVLRSIGGRESLPSLRSLLDDPDRAVATAAQAACDAIAVRHDLSTED
ncbi:MAG TPA: M56 family metallopeptidase [Pirellulales bacterium]|nr:M56 family metallopeptidase [Pirellulales bacterium]